MDQKITINNRGFYVIPECKKGNYTLCVASESWGASTWGEGTNGQQILDIADNRNPESLTSYWFNTLPDIIKEAMLTVSVTTDDYNKSGKGALEQTEMFVPNYSEWEKVPRNIRKMVTDNSAGWSRSYYGYGNYGALYIDSFGCVGNSSHQNVLYAVVPAFYISDDYLRSLDEENTSL